MSPFSLRSRAANLLARKTTTMAALQKRVPDALWITDEEGKKTFASDVMPFEGTPPLAVVLPTTTEEISEILKDCHAHNIKVMARGAGTSLCGGATPDADTLVICLSRMNRIIDCDYNNRTATVQAGVTGQALAEAVQPNKFFFAPDPDSLLACTIGGNIAMNASGRRGLKYGVTSNNILGVKMVMMDGQILKFGGKWMETSGYDFLALIAGSEGQLGIVTEATVRIIRQPEGARPMMIGFGVPQNASECAAAIISNGILPTAIEFMDETSIEICKAYINKAHLPDAKALLIVEVEGTDTEIDEQFEKLRDIARLFAPTLFREAQTEEERANIWLGMNSIYGAIGKKSDYYCTDGIIPPGALPDILPKIRETGDSYKLQIANIFRAGDGTLHSFILYDANNGEESEKVRQCGADILTLCLKYGGALSGEHGIGLQKRDLMPVQFTWQELAQQTAIKTIFDPQWLLNPSRVFPPAQQPETSPVAEASGEEAPTTTPPEAPEDPVTPEISASTPQEA